MHIRGPPAKDIPCRRAYYGSLILSDFPFSKNFLDEYPLLSLLRKFRFSNWKPNQSIRKEIPVIHQISEIKTKTGALPQIDRGLIRARHIQSHLKVRFASERVPSHIELCNPSIEGACLVRVSRWIE